MRILKNKIHNFFLLKMQFCTNTSLQYIKTLRKFNLILFTLELIFFLNKAEGILIQNNQ